MGYRINEDILNNIKQEAIKNHVPILQDVSLDLILTILSIKRPRKILEIGTAVGYSAIQFSRYLEDSIDSKIKTIEINENMYNIAIKNIKDMNLQEKIEVCLEDATTYLDTLDENKESYDVIFIDAAKGQYLKYLKNALRLINKRGIIIADNVLFKGRVLSDYNEHRHRTATNRLREYLKIINEDERLDSHLFKIGDGVAVSIVR